MFATKSLLRRSFISASHSKKFLIYRYRCQARRCRSDRLPTSPVLKATQHNEALESQTSQSLQSTLLCSVAKVTSRGLLQTEGAWLCQVLVNHEKVVRMTCPPPGRVSRSFEQLWIRSCAATILSTVGQARNSGASQGAALMQISLAVFQVSFGFVADGMQKFLLQRPMAACTPHKALS